LTFSQGIYPKVKVVDGDTTIIITPSQLKEVNKIIIQRNYYQTDDSISRVQLSKSENKCLYLSKEVSQLETKVVNLTEGLSIKESQFSMKFSDQKKFYDDSLNKQKLKTVSFTIGGVVVGFSFGVVLILLVH
jgi:hypothetical protein